MSLRTEGEAISDKHIEIVTFAAMTIKGKI